MGTHPGCLSVVGVDIIYSVAGVQVVVWRDRGPDEGNAGDPCCVRVVIEQFELVVVSVAKELGDDR